MPFGEIVRIREAETVAMAIIEQARADAEGRIQKAHADAREAEGEARQRAGAEVVAHIAAVEAEASAKALTIHATAAEEIAAIRAATEARLEEAIAFIVGEVAGDAQTG